MFNFSNKKKQRLISTIIAVALVVVMVVSCIVTSVGGF